MSGDIQNADRDSDTLRTASGLAAAAVLTATTAETAAEPETAADEAPVTQEALPEEDPVTAVADGAIGHDRVEAGSTVRMGGDVTLDLSAALAQSAVAIAGPDRPDAAEGPAGHVTATVDDLRAITTLAIPSDTLFPKQWHLNNSGQSGGVPGLDINVTKVWDEFTGAGVTVGIWDDGVQYTHDDLNDSYDTGLHITVGGVPHDPLPQSVNSKHGTAVAGLIAAENNGTGTVGVAFGATIAAVDMFFDPALDFENSFLELDNFDITNHSWGYTTPFAANILSPGWATFFAGWSESVATGRGGLGTINVKAAGNDRTAGRDANDSNLNNLPQTIAVAAVSHDDNLSWYSTPGAAVLIAATSNGASGAGIWTTDRTGADGYSNGSNQIGNTDADYTSSFGGTSSASPITAGVVALMLEANPDLGWRDVQTILAATARHVGSDIGAGPSGNELYTWTVNGATTWNGGGMHFSNDYGYGLIDALAAVRVAESWTEQNTSANWKVDVAGSWSGNLFIPDNNPTGVTVQFAVTDETDLEHVALKLGWDTGSEVTGAYLVTLTSPDGTTTILSRPQNNGDSSTDSWVYMSNQFRGEASVGTWTVRVADLWAGLASSLTSAQLEFYGNAVDSDDTWIFTNEYSELAGGAFGHATAIADTNGGVDILNAAAVTADTTIRLNKGNGIVDGVTITVSGFEDVVTGDGNDVVYGDGADNWLRGGRGSDVIRGIGGNDVIDGGQGNDTVNGGIGDDTVSGGSGDDLIFGKAGVDILSGNAGNDVINGARDNDTISGGAGDDILRGQANNDWLTDGTGADRLNGGLGADIFDLVVDSSTDTIFDYKDGVDTIRLAGLGFGALTFTDIVPGRVQIDYAGDTLIVRDGGVGALVAADLDAGDFLFV